MKVFFILLFGFISKNGFSQIVKPNPYNQYFYWEAGKNECNYIAEISLKNKFKSELLFDESGQLIRQKIYDISGKTLLNDLVLLKIDTIVIIDTISSFDENGIFRSREGNLEVNKDSIQVIKQLFKEYSLFQKTYFENSKIRSISNVNKEGVSSFYFDEKGTLMYSNILININEEIRDTIEGVYFIGFLEDKLIFEIYSDRKRLFLIETDKNYSIIKYEFINSSLSEKLKKKTIKNFKKILKNRLW